MDISTDTFGERDPQRVELSASGGGDANAPNGPDGYVPFLAPRQAAESALPFLDAVCREGRIALGAIHSVSGEFHGATYDLCADRERLVRVITAAQGKYNLYYRINEPVPREQQTGKNGAITRKDLNRFRGVVVDIDPPKDIEATPGGLKAWRVAQKAKLAGLMNEPHGPTAIVDSGGGFQLIWVFRDFLPATDEIRVAVEDLSRRLGALYGGDDTHDAAHLFRVPFTDNLPNAAKRARGRKPAATMGAWMSPPRLHTLEGLTAITPPAPTKAVSAPALPFNTDDAAAAAGYPDGLSDELAAQVENACARDELFDRRLRTAPPVAGSGKRSEHDFALACAAVEVGVTDRSDVAAVVAAYGSDKYEEKLGEPGRGSADSYLVNTVNKAFAKVEAAKAADAALLSPIEDEDGGTGAGAEEAGAFGDDEPADLLGEDDLGALGTPPDDSTPDVIDAYARTEAARIGVPPIFSAMAALTVVGGAIGSALQIQPRRHDPTYTEPAAIWTVLDAPSGCAKSPTNSSAAKPLRAVDAQLMKANERERQAYEARKAALGKDKAALGPAPLRRRAVIDDVTTEQQIRLHQSNPRGLMRLVDEYASFTDFGAYKKSGGGDRGKALGFFDGGSMTIDRVSEDRPIHAESVLMGLLSSTQPDRIGPLFRNLGVDGLSQRTLFIVWDGIERRFIDQPPDLRALAEYASAVTALAGIDKMSGHVVRLSNEAHDVADEIDRRIRAHAHLPNASAAWEGHISKWGKIFPRLLLIFHALETWDAAGCVPADALVTAETTRKAGRLALFLLKHSWQFYRVNSGPQDRAAAVRWIAGWIVAHPEHDRFTPRHIERAYKEARKDRLAFLSAMRSLEEAGWVRPSRPAAPGSAGPAEWAVNPRVYERFAEHGVRERAARAEKRAKIKAAAAAQREGAEGV